MAGASTVLLVGGLALAAVGTGVQFSQQRKSQKEQEKAAETARAREQEQARRQRRRVLREQRIAKAQLINTAAQTGAQGGSGEAGGVSSLASQAGAELGFITGQQAFSDRITRSNIAASRAASRASTAGAVAGLGGQMASFGVSQGGLGNLFGSGSQTQGPSSSGFFRFGQFAGQGRTPGGF